MRGETASEGRKRWMGGVRGEGRGVTERRASRRLLQRWCYYRGVATKVLLPEESHTEYCSSSERVRTAVNIGER